MSIIMFNRDPKTARVGKEILPFEMGYLPEYFQKKAEVELNDSPERRVQELRRIREMAKNDKTFEGLEFDDDIFLDFLSNQKFNVMKAFSRLKCFVNFRRSHSYMFQNFNFENTVKVIRDEIVTFLPLRCQDGCAIMLIQLANWNPEDFPVEEVERMLVIFLRQSFRDPMTRVNGYKVICDVKSNLIRHIKYCTPRNVYLLYHGTQECSPGRFRAIHIVNSSRPFKVAWLLAKTFFSEKFKERVHFHSDTEELFNFFPRSVIPLKYGGELADYDMTHWLRNIMQPEKLALIDSGAKF